MKQCPQCGYKPTINNRRMLKLFAAHFPGVPVMEMGERQWITLDIWNVQGKVVWNEDQVPELLTHVQRELMEFCRVDSVDALKTLFGWEGDLMDRDYDLDRRRISDLNHQVNQTTDLI